ncbi:MAG: response regulator [Pyrinomonadaceae bacterium]
MRVRQNKILIVDDDSSIRLALAEALRSWNYESAAAARLANARRLFDAEDPHVVPLDIDLPDGSGLDFLTDIKA